MLLTKSPAAGAPPARKQADRQWARVLTSRLRLLPDFIIIGTQRGGTTSLYRYLSAHPLIVPASRKEVHFFDRNFAKGERFYRSCFPLALRRAWSQAVRRRPLVTGEASPYYLYHPLVPQRILGLVPGARFIVLLRNPVDRALSHYERTRRHGKEDLPFEAALACEAERLAELECLPVEARYRGGSHQAHSYTSRGRYAEQLERWFDLFPRERFLILNSEQFFAESQSGFDRVLDFLDLPRHPVPGETRVRKPRYAAMTPATRKHLIDHFAPENERLFQLLGERFDWR